MDLDLLIGILSIFSVVCVIVGAVALYEFVRARRAGYEWVNLNDPTLRQVQAFSDACGRRLLARELDEAMGASFATVNERRDTTPVDLGCFTLPSGECLGTDCMHSTDEGTVDPPPGLIDWDQDIVSAPVTAAAPPARSVLEGYDAQALTNIVAGAARAWRLGMTGSEDVLQHWVDRLDRVLSADAHAAEAVPPVGSDAPEPPRRPNPSRHTVGGDPDK